MFFSPPSPLSAKYMGCYVDSIKNRALSGPSLIDYKKMTVARCQDNCAERYEGNKTRPSFFFIFFFSFFNYFVGPEIQEVIKEKKNSVI